MKKCAWIRSDKGENKCPFGLPITEACKNAGNSVLHMYVLDKNTALEINQRIYLYYKTDERCMYAANVIDGQASVNCNFGDVGEGQHMPAMEGSPLYVMPFTGVNMDGWQNSPSGTYGDNYPSRNVPFGLFSLVSSEEYELIKTAAVENADLQNIITKIETQQVLTEEEGVVIGNIVGRRE